MAPNPKAVTCGPFLPNLRVGSCCGAIFAAKTDVMLRIDRSEDKHSSETQKAKETFIILTLDAPGDSANIRAILSPHLTSL